jgi:hypothetical protein
VDIQIYKGLDPINRFDPATLYMDLNFPSHNYNVVFYVFSDLGWCSFCWYWWHCWPSLFTLSFHSTITFVLAISLNKKLKLQIFLLTHVQNFEYETNEYIKYKLFKRVVNSTITTIHYFVECQKWIHQFILILVYYLLLKHINNQISLNDWDYIFV